MHFYHTWFRHAPCTRLIRPQHRSQRIDVLSEEDQGEIKLTVIGMIVTLVIWMGLLFRDLVGQAYNLMNFREKRGMRNEENTERCLSLHVKYSIYTF